MGDNKKVIIVFALIALLLIAFVVWAFVFLSSAAFPSLHIGEMIGNISEALFPTVLSEYRPYHVMTIDYAVGDAVLRNGWIYFAGIQDGMILVERMRPDTSHREVVAEMSAAESAELVIGLDLTGDGQIRLLIQDSAFGGRILYAAYSRAGRLRSERELETPSFFAARANINRFISTFMADGSILIDGHDAVTCDVFLYTFDADGHLIGFLASDCGSSAQTRDGRALSFRWERQSVYEFDFVTGIWDEGSFLSVYIIRRLYTATDASGFDLYIDAELDKDGTTILAGYDWESDTFTRLLNWDELGFRPRGRDSTIMLPDRMVLFRRSESYSGPTIVMALPYEARIY